MYRPSQTPRLNLSSAGRGKSHSDERRRIREGICAPTNELKQSVRTSQHTHRAPRSASPLTPDAIIHHVYSPVNRVEYGDEGSSGISLFGGTPKRTGPSHLCCTSDVSVQIQTRVKLNRVFFPRCVHASPFPCLLVHQTVDRDSRNLVNPFMRVTN